MNEDTFTQIYNEYAGKIYRFSMFKLNNKENAEDIVSDTFVALHAANVEKIDNIQAWLFKVARNTMYDKHFKKDNITENINDEIEEYNQFEIQQNELENQAITDLEKEIIHDNLLKLDKTTSEIIALKIWDGFSFKDIADVVSLKESATKLRFYRGVEQLKTLCSTQQNVSTRSFSFPVILGGIYMLSKEGMYSFGSAETILQNILTISVGTMANNAANTIAGGATIGATVTKAGILSTITGKAIVGGVAALTLGGAAVGATVVVTQDDNSSEDETVIDDQIIQENRNILTKDCILEGFFVSEIPENWTCSRTEELGESNFVVEIQAEELAINISNLGRGVSCTPEDSLCEVESFDVDSTVPMSIYKYNGAIQEIFGSVQSSIATNFISVKFNEELESIEEQVAVELEAFLSTAMFVNQEDQGENVSIVTKECNIDGIVESKIPENWNCSRAEKQGEVNYTLQMTAEDFTITASNFGRGGPCDGVTCETQSFTGSSNIPMTIYYQEGAIVEIFGVTQGPKDTNSSISVLFDQQTTELTNQVIEELEVFFSSFDLIENESTAVNYSKPCVLSGFFESKIASGWTCSRAEQLGETEFLVEIQSPNFSISSSNLGRGVSCDTSDSRCEISQFTGESAVALSVYKYDGVVQEIFGSTQGSGWISITFNTERTSVSQATVSELEPFLTTVSFLN